MSPGCLYVSHGCSLITEHATMSPSATITQAALITFPSYFRKPHFTGDWFIVNFKFVMHKFLQLQLFFQDVHGVYFELIGKAILLSFNPGT